MEIGTDSMLYQTGDYYTEVGRLFNVDCRDWEFISLLGQGTHRVTLDQSPREPFSLTYFEGLCLETGATNGAIIVPKVIIIVNI